MQEEKYCGKCQKTKPLSEFSKNPHKKLGVQAWCRECSRKENNRRYKEDPKYKIRINKNNTEVRKRNRQFIWDYLSSHPCVDCGEKDPVVLEFDHVRDSKSFNMATGSRWLSLEKIKKEIEKCDIRCANCHRRKTALERGYYSTIDKEISEESENGSLAQSGRAADF